jgi:hypothetical protein
MVKPVAERVDLVDLRPQPNRSPARRAWSLQKAAEWLSAISAAFPLLTDME